MYLYYKINSSFIKKKTVTKYNCETTKKNHEILIYKLCIDLL